jgi:Fe-Mn family superoxide dismutase
VKSNEDLEQSFTRRECIATLALSGAALAMGCAGAQPAHPLNASSQIGATTMTETRAFAANHTPVALPFDPKALKGLSDRMMVSHHENNYGGAVRNLNRCEQELSAIKAETPPFVVAALRERELNFRNSKALHEAYFGNLGGDGKRSGAIETTIAAAYGASSRWEEHFRATGMGLGGGSGWVILSYELDTASLRTIASASHTQTLSTSVPLLVMDMYEHSYHIDFGAAVARYIDAFFANIQWDAVNARLERAERAAAILSGKTA